MQSEFQEFVTDGFTRGRQSISVCELFVTGSKVSKTIATQYLSGILEEKFETSVYEMNWNQRKSAGQAR